jgi:hypothetical protein
VEVVIGRDTEQGQLLIEEPSSLGRYADPARNSGAAVLQLVEDRSHFDGLWAGAEDGKDFEHGGLSLSFLYARSRVRLK